MRVLVTGAAGFIGSHLCRALLEGGNEVTGLDNFCDRYSQDHFDRRIRSLPNTFQIIHADVRNASAVADAVRATRPDAIYHLAALASVRRSVSDPLPYGEVNVQGSMNVLSAAASHGVNHLILASTGSVYGTDTPVPFREDSPADRPLAAYAASKRSMELLAHAWHHLHGLNVTVLRLFNVYGPYGRPDMMPWQWAFAIKEGRPITLYGEGMLQRDWTFIDDTVAGLLAAMRAAGGYQIINVGRGKPVANIDFVHTLERLLDRKANIEHLGIPLSEPLITYAATDKARCVLSYDPLVDIEEGLSRFLKWLRSEELF